MDFSLSSEQTALQDSVRRFCEREYDFETRRKLLATPEGFSRAHWAKFAELGWLGAGLSEEDGGYGGTAVDNTLILEQMGRALVLEPFLSCAVIAARAVAAVAEGEARETLLAAIVGGEQLVAFAHNETAMRGDDAKVETRADKTTDGYVLSGRKAFVLGGPSADVLLVSARIGSGISLFAIESKTAGLEQVAYHAVDGRRVSDVILTDVRVPADKRLGAEGAALSGIELAVDHGVVGILAESVGAMDAALWLTRDYLKTRKQFGVTLNTFQALQHRMADMLVETELARSMLYKALASLAETDVHARRKGISAAKVQIGEAGHFVTTNAIQLHGGIGVTEEYVVGHYFKRAVMARNLFGPTDVHVARYARLAPQAPPTFGVA